MGSLNDKENYKVHQQVFRRASFCEVAQSTLFDKKMAGSDGLRLCNEPWSGKVADPVQMVCVRMKDLLQPVPGK